MVGQDKTSVAWKTVTGRQVNSDTAPRQSRPLQHHRGDGLQLLRHGAGLGGRGDQDERHHGRVREDCQQVRWLPAVAHPRHESDSEDGVVVSGQPSWSSPRDALCSGQGARVLHQPGTRQLPSIPQQTPQHQPGAGDETRQRQTQDGHVLLHTALVWEPQVHLQLRQSTHQTRISVW